MNKHHRALELDKILELLAAQAVCADTAEAARSLRPSLRLSEVQLLLEETESQKAYDAWNRIKRPERFAGTN